MVSGRAEKVCHNESRTTSLQSLLGLRDVAGLLWDALDPTSRRQLYAVSESVRRQLTPLIFVLILKIPINLQGHPIDQKWDDTIKALSFLPADVIPSMNPCGLTLSLRFVWTCSYETERQMIRRKIGPKRGNGGALAAFLEAFSSHTSGNVLQCIHHLDINNAKLGPAVMAALNKGYGDSCCLKSLTLEDCKVPKQFFTSGALTQLTLLSCERIVKAIQQGDPTIVLHCTALTMLKLYDCTLCRADVAKDLARGLPHLQSLQLGGAEGDAVEVLAKDFPNLVRLEVELLEPYVDLHLCSCTWEELVILYIDPRCLARTPLHGLKKPFLAPDRPLSPCFSRHTRLRDVQAMVSNLLLCPTVVPGFGLDLYWARYHVSAARYLRLITGLQGLGQYLSYVKFLGGQGSDVLSEVGAILGPYSQAVTLEEVYDHIYIIHHRDVVRP